MKLGLAIAKRRESLGLTQEELAQAVGVSKASISRWESGDISNMRRDRIHNLAEALQISPLKLLDEETDGFFDDENEKPPTSQITEKQADAIKLICSLSPDEFNKTEEFVKFIISQRENKSLD